MASAVTRGLRSKSSRYSSPAVVAEKDSEINVEDVVRGGSGGKTFLDRWVEPPLRPPAPSFEDTKGLERVGVLEHMAPLGQPPTQKLIQRLKLGLHRPAARTTLGQSEDVATPSTEFDKMDLGSPIDLEARADSIQPEDVVPLPKRDEARPLSHENGDMNPGNASISLAVTDRSPVSLKRSTSDLRNDSERRRLTRKGKSRTQRPLIDQFSERHYYTTSPDWSATPSPKRAAFAPSISASPRDGSFSSPSLPSARLQAHFEGAMEEAERAGSNHLVPGLRKLHEDAQTNPELLVVLEAILQNRPSRAQFKIFKRYIKYGIKRYEHPGSEDLMDVDLRPGSQAATQSGHRGHHIKTSTRSLSTIVSPIRLKSSLNQRNHHKSPSKPSPSSRTTAKDKMAPTAARSNGDEPRTRATSRRRRSGSVSSSSSLSSAKSIDEPFTHVAESDGTTHGNRARAGRSSGARQAANRVAAGNKTRPSATSAPPAKHPFSDFPTTSQFAAKRFKKSKNDLNIDQAEIEKRRREFEQRSFADYNYVDLPNSHERMAVTSVERPHSSMSLGVQPPITHPHPLNASPMSLTSPESVRAPPEPVTTNGTRRKRGYQELDQDEIDIHTPRSSSPGLSLAPPPPPMSRAATPRAAKAAAQLPGKVRKSARVLVSPNKPKNGGVTAGISRPGSSREVAPTNRLDSESEDNDETCASCGGEGTLLCCDGCPNSFHFACLEPPLDPDKEIEEGEWFCQRCTARKNQVPSTPIGLFGPLLRLIDNSITKAYALTYEIRDYFEGVRTGDEGEYEEVGMPRTQNNPLRMNRAGFFEEPNYKELRDGKNNFITCWRCGLTSNGRDIIPCDFCSARWHLDCLDPPLAVAPRRRVPDKPNGTWRCPLHVEHGLARVGRSELAAPGEIGKANPRVRRPKHATPQDTDLPRGFLNNGIIEVELTKEEEVAIQEVEMHGTVYRLPERGIRLDFIDRVKKSWYEDNSFPGIMRRSRHLREAIYRPDFLPREQTESVGGQRIPQYTPRLSHNVPQDLSSAIIEANAAANASLRRKTLREQQAILNLARLSQQEALSSAMPGSGEADKEQFEGDKLAELTNRLVVEAPEEVNIMDQGSEKEMLERLMTLAQRRLMVLDDATKTAENIRVDPTHTPATLARNLMARQLNIALMGMGQTHGEEGLDGDSQHISGLDEEPPSTGVETSDTQVGNGGEQPAKYTAEVPLPAPRSAVEQYTNALSNNTARVETDPGSEMDISG